MKNLRNGIAAAAAPAAAFTVATARADVTSALGIPTQNDIELWPKTIAGEKLNFTATDHFGYTPETGVMLTIAGGEWKAVGAK